MPRFETPIELPSNPSEDLEAATKQYVDSQAGGANELSDLTDVDTDGVANNNFLRYSESVGEWLPVAVSPGSGAENLDDLNDVDIPSVGEGDMLYLNDSGLWVVVAGSKDEGSVPTVQDDGSVEWATPTGGGITDISEVAGLSHWFDPDDAATVALDGSNRVEQLDDKSGNGFHATQGTAGSRPRVVAHNGRTWLDFSIGNDFLSTSSSASRVRLGRHIFAVVYLPGSHTGARRAIIEGYGSTADAGFSQASLEISASNQLAGASTDGTFRTAVDDVTFPTSTEVVCFYDFISGGGLRVGRSDEPNRGGGNVLGQVHTGGSFTGFRIGTFRDANDRFYNGYLGELVIVDRWLSPSEVQQVLSLLVAKWV